MKSKLWMRVITMSLSILLVFLMASCSGSKNSSSSSSQGSSSSGAAGKTPITLTIGFCNGAPIGDGTHQDYAVLKELTNLTGVTLDFITYDDAKLKVLMAGGDLPDIVMFGSDTSEITNALSAKLVMKLDDLLDQYGQNIKSNIPTALKWSKQVIGKGEGTYILPVAVGQALPVPAPNGYVGFASRYDIYKAVGSPAVNGPDGFLNVLKQMQDYQRQKTGNKNIYALSAFNDSGMWPWSIPYPFAMGYYPISDNQMVNGFSGEIQDSLYDGNSILWQAMSFYNKAWRMGIFDPDGFTMKLTQYTDKIANGTVLSTVAPWWQPNTATCGTSAVDVYLPGAFPVLPAVYGLDSPLGYNAVDSRAISSKCKDPVRAMQLLNWLDSTEGGRLLTDGVKGVDWDMVNGKPQLTGARRTALLNGTTPDYDKTNKTGLDNTGLKSFMTSMNGNVAKTDDGYPIDLTNMPDYQAEVKPLPQNLFFAKDFDPSFTYPGQVYDKWIKEGTGKTITGYPLAAFLIQPSTTKTQQAESQAQTYFMDNVAKIVMAKDDVAFAKVKSDMLAQFKAMGLDACDAEIQNNYRTAQQQAASFLK